MDRACSRNEEKNNAYRMLVVEKLEGKRPLGRPRGWWVGNTMTWRLKAGIVEGVEAIIDKQRQAKRVSVDANGQWAFLWIPPDYKTRISSNCADGGYE
jgi:hypothetical protein